jgi:hypothetical protein
MRREQMKNLLILAALLLISTQSFAFTNPAQVIIKLYGIGVSTSLDCSNPILVNSWDGGKEFDFKQSPFLGGSSVPEGTYPCVILRMSDVIKFRPQGSDGTSCVAGTQYTIDVCRSGTGTYTPFTNNTFGATAACTGTQGTPAEDKVLLFLTTASTNTGSGSGAAFVRPVSTADGFKLNNPFVVSGSKSGTFVVNFDNKVDGSQPVCDLSAPTFNFR